VDEREEGRGGGIRENRFLTGPGRAIYYRGEKIKKILLTLLCLLVFTGVIGCGDNAGPVPATPLPPVAIPPDARLVGLFFDDGFLNQYRVALPVLHQHGFRATFAIITGSIGKGHGLWEYMDKKELQELANDGMDIASHTRTHANLTANLTDKRLRQEIYDSKKELEGMGFRVSTMVYPYYAWNDRVVACVREAGYTCARAGWSKEKAYDLTNANASARYHVFSWQITNQDMEQFKLYLKEAGLDRLVGLTYHFIADDGPAETSTPVANFQAQMAYLAGAGYTVVPLFQLFAAE
jgi:peptidoglycan/xylan/chitin deacetylase (PgdA/CDA1 family)